MPTLICCEREAQSTNGKTIYPHRKDLWGLPYWKCLKCGGYVGCHPGTEIPLGTPATKNVSRARSRAHEVFDQLWRKKYLTRGQAYKWLQDALDEPKEIHIGQANLKMCQRIVEASQGKLKKMKRLRR